MKKNYDSQIPLGKKVQYPDLRDSSLLFPISREQYRADLPACPHDITGLDVWNSYEFSWLDKTTGWPVHGHLTLIFSSKSSHIIESKSLKIYLGSYANTLMSLEQVLETLKKDLSLNSGSEVQVHFRELNQPEPLISLEEKKIVSLENIDILSGHFECFFEGFKSMCPVTSSPDYATIVLMGKIDEPLAAKDILDYLLSFAQAQEFHEHCVESIIRTLSNRYLFKELSILGYFTRRGSLDINPLRTTLKNAESLVWSRQALN